MSKYVFVCLIYNGRIAQIVLSQKQFMLLIVFKFVIVNYTTSLNSYNMSFSQREYVIKQVAHNKSLLSTSPHHQKMLSLTWQNLMSTEITFHHVCEHHLLTFLTFSPESLILAKILPRLGSLPCILGWPVRVTVLPLMTIITIITVVNNMSIRHILIDFEMLLLIFS